MKLGKEHCRQLRDDGYTIIRGAVPRLLTERALKAIHHDLGAEGMDPARLDEYRARSYCPTVSQTPAISDLINASPALGLADSVLGRWPLRPVNGGQIALRFPSASDLPGPAAPHIDGTDYTKRSEADTPPAVGVLQSFSLLCGVLLADIPEENSGNFTVWPGTHHIVGEWIREHGIAELAKPGSVCNIRDRVEWPEPLQVVGEAGDLLFTHHFTAHGVTPNISHRIRYACFFRLHCEGHDSRREVIYHEDMWHEWQGLRELLGDA